MTGSGGTAQEPGQPGQRPESAPRYARIIVDVEPAHLDHPFDYRIPDGWVVRPGQQVRVSFAGRRRTGWVLAVGSQTTAEPSRIKRLERMSGDIVWFDEDDLRLFRWVARRWGGTLTSVLRHALPKRVAGVEDSMAHWGEPPPVPAEEPPSCPAKAWRAYPAATMLHAVARSRHGQPAPAFWWHPLPGDDVAGMIADLVRRCLEAGRAALVLAPDPAAGVRESCLASAGAAGVDLGAARSERDRYRAFLRCRTGHARMAVGERAAAFAPLRDLGLVVVSDEASPGYKERRSPRHHAREVALARARMAGAVTVLTGALPSAATWRLVSRGDVVPVTASRAVTRLRVPRVELVHRQAGPVRARLAPQASAALRDAIRAGAAVAVLVARTGEGTALACRRCGERLLCPTCDGALHQAQEAPARWRCGTCGWDGKPTPCPGCHGTAFVPLAAGTARWAAELSRAHPDAEVQVMEGFDAPGPTRRPAIAVMTRGSVVRTPAWLGHERVRVLVLPDVDAMLGRPRFDAAEDTLRLLLSVAWAERMIVQTRSPTGAAVQALMRWDPLGFWRAEAPRRSELGYPPARVLIRLSTDPPHAAELADGVRRGVPAGDIVLGPDLDGTVLLKSENPYGTLSALDPLVKRWAREDRGVRVDVDPVPALEQRG